MSCIPRMVLMSDCVIKIGCILLCKPACSESMMQVGNSVHCAWSNAGLKGPWLQEKSSKIPGQAQFLAIHLCVVYIVLAVHHDHLLRSFIVNLLFEFSRDARPQ